MTVGTDTSSWRLGLRSTSRMPSSRPIFSAAVSNCFWEISNGFSDSWAIRGPPLRCDGGNGARNGGSERADSRLPPEDRQIRVTWAFGLRWPPVESSAVQPLRWEEGALL